MPWRTRTGGSNPDARLRLITRCFLSRNSALICGPIPSLLYNLLTDTTLLCHRDRAIQCNTMTHYTIHTILYTLYHTIPLWHNTSQYLPHDRIQYQLKPGFFASSSRLLVSHLNQTPADPTSSSTCEIPGARIFHSAFVVGGRDPN